MVTRYGTGISGFIGSHLAKKVDILPIPHEKIKSVKIKPFDYFYFLSSYGNMIQHTDEEKMFQANVLDLVTVLTKIKKIPFKCFFFMSTSSIMLKRQTTYSRMKRVAEELLLAYMERHNLPVCIAQPFSVTGVGEQSEHLIPTLLRAAKTGEIVNFVPQVTHDWIDVDDVVNGIISLTEHKARGIFQLGTGIKTTNQQVLNLVEEVTGKKININVVESLREYDSLDWVSYNYKARTYGWMPRVTLYNSIKQQYEANKS